MNTLLKIIFAVALIKAFIVFLLIVAGIILGVSRMNLLIPGLGLVISGSLIMFLLVAAEIILIPFVIILWRYLKKPRLR